MPTSLVSRLCQARSRRPGRSRDRPDAVLPAVAGDEVAARVAHHRDAQLAGQREHVAAEAVLVGGRVAGLVDAGVDAAAHVLDERAEGAAGDRRDGEGRVEANEATNTVLLQECGHGYLRLPTVRPPRQYRCRRRNATISGTIDDQGAHDDHVEERPPPPLPMLADWYQVRRPTVSG